MADIFGKEKDDNSKGKGRGRMVLGLLLVVLAVLMYSYRNGFFDSPFDKKGTDAEYIAEALVKSLNSFNEYLVSEYVLIPSGKGSGIGNITISRSSDDSLLNLSKWLGTDAEDYEKKLEGRYDGNTYIVTDGTSGETLVMHEFSDVFDIGAAASKKAANGATVKKLLEKYEGIFFKELFKDGITSGNENYINNLDGVILVEKEYLFAVTESDTVRALRACADAAREDKTLKKAYAVLSSGKCTFDEAVDRFEAMTDASTLFLFDVKKADGIFYVNVSEGLTMADMTLVRGETAKHPGYVHLKAGYTYLNRQVGFVFDYDDGENVVNVLGNGIYNAKSTTINATGNGFVKGSAVRNGEGTGFTFTLSDLQPIRAQELYVAGNVEIVPEDAEIAKVNIELLGENGLQQINSYLTFRDGGEGLISLVRER